MAEARAQVDLSRIKNKIKRRNAFQSEKLKRSKDKRERRKKRKREEEGFGDQVPPKQMPRTIENTRVADETVVDPKDIEVLKNEENDELASYFQGQVVPKVLITSCQNAKLDTVHFMEDLQEVIPNSEIRERKGFELKRVIPQAKEKGFTTVVVVNEDRKKPNGLLVIHLPNGPTAHFQLSSVKAGKSIKNHGCMTSHKPEVLLNNFNTRLGHSVGRLLAALFPYDPQFVGRQCVTFHNQRDFIFFRRHRYIFKNAKKVGLQEIGPRFTLKLRSLQYGTYDPMFGEYEWMYKRNEMDKSRRKFNLS